MLKQNKTKQNDKNKQTNKQTNKKQQQSTLLSSHYLQF